MEVIGLVLFLVILYALFSKKRKPIAVQETKQCRFCAEPIRFEARICRYCNQSAA